MSYKNSLSDTLGISSYRFGDRILTPSLLSSVQPYLPLGKSFKRFHDNIILTPTQQKDGNQKRENVVKCLNQSYYHYDSPIDNSFFIGSWSKNTAIRPPRDVDIYFLLPLHIFTRFYNYTHNGQSALLQEVKTILSDSFPKTQMKGDGQVVVVSFGSYKVEVVPAFELRDGRYYICNTNDGGSYIITNPFAEFEYIDTIDNLNEHTLRPLIRILKVWQSFCKVPIKSFLLELLTAEFIQQLSLDIKNWSSFHIMIYDFFNFLYQKSQESAAYVPVPGTSEKIFIDNELKMFALRAKNCSSNALRYERKKQFLEANKWWQKIFGDRFSRRDY